jgi:hypothetical protein
VSGRTAIAATIVAAMAVGGVGVVESTAGPVDGQVVSGHTFRLPHGQLGFARVTAKPTAIPKQYRDRLSQADPDKEGGGGATPKVRTGPLLTGPINAPAMSVAVAAAAIEPVIYHRRLIGTPQTTTSEPTSANIADANLVTYNTYAAVMTANGHGPVRFVNPFEMFNQPGGGLCCDQRAYSTTHHGMTRLFWLQLYSAKDYTDTTGDGHGLLKLVVYHNRDELVQQKGFCHINISPAQVGFPPSRSWFDFPQISASNKYLYISAEANQVTGDAPPGQPDPSAHLGSVVMRIPMDEFDSENCDQTPTIQLFQGFGAGFHPSFVKGSAAGDVMYWAFHSLVGGRQALTVVKAPDSAPGASATAYTREITPYTSTDFSVAQSHCEVPPPDGTNPCARLGDTLLAANFDGQHVGWFWHVREGGPGHAFPYVRGARFATSNLALTQEPELSDPNHAIVYPAMAANDPFDTAITAYRIGGGEFPTAITALVDHVTNNWSTIHFTDVHHSTGGSIFNRWGDYQSINRYLGCLRTWGATYGSQNGEGALSNGLLNPRVHWMWLGQAEDGCPDLSMRAVTVKTGIAPDQITVDYTVQNTGSATAGASRTRFYLSRDGSRSPDDLRLPGGSDVHVLHAGKKLDGVAIEDTSSAGAGTFYVIACADDLKAVLEVSEHRDDNCLATGKAITGSLHFGGAEMAGLRSSQADAAPAFNPGDRVRVDLSLRAAAGVKKAAITLGLSATGSARDLTRAGGSTVTLASASGAAKPGKLRRRTVRRTLTIPHGLRHRRQFIVACTTSKPRADRCLASRNPIYVRGAPAP